MKYPSINKKQVLDAVNFYNENPELCSHVVIEMGTTVEQWMERLNERAKKDSDGKLEKSLIVYRKYRSLLSEKSIEVINKLLGDRKIRNKIRIVYDGSYLVNRIWSYVDLEKEQIVIRPEFNGYEFNVNTSEFDKLSPKKQIDWLYNHFDVIYVQITLVKSLQDILSTIEFEKEMDYFDRAFNY